MARLDIANWIFIQNPLGLNRVPKTRRSMQTMQTPRQGPVCHVGSAAVCLPESVGVTLFEREVPTLLVAGPLLFEILLSHHVQLGIGGQNCFHRRLLSRFPPDRIPRPLLRSSTVSCAMSIQRSYPTHDKRRQRHHHKKTHGFEFSGHNQETTTGNALMATFMGEPGPRSEQSPG